MSLIQISINNTGEHWDKQIRLFGILIYHRQEFTANGSENRQIGFTAAQYCPGEIYDE